MSFLDDFLFRAAVAGLGVVVAAAPLGCFVVWRRMAYFGDATAHSAILGVALALAFEVSIFLGVLVASLSMAGLVSVLGGRAHTSDTLLGVLAHSGLAFGLVALSLLPITGIDPITYLFGDILAVGRIDVAVIWSGAVLVLLLLSWRWSPLLTATLNPDLAHASGIAPRRERLVLTFALALTVAVAIKVVGALLIAAMLLIPAATARTFASSPERMVVFAALAGGSSVLGGLGLAYLFDTPAGPTIICLAVVFFALSVLWDVLRSNLTC